MIESGSLRWRFEPLGLEEVIRRSVETTAPLFEAKGIAVTMEIAPLPPAIGDRDRLHQVLINLLSNAAKFTQAGTVRITARPDAGRREIIVAVKDSGRGVPAGDLEIIFEKFRRSGGEQGTADGTGLGLAISHQIIAQHGGRIWAASEPGSGSTFSFALPAAPGAG
ncbi:MAG: HAMP domain-containing sensor histidine kinase [Nitrospiraceae bacterium]|nr:HAMP domain-containing sensor histidine kinase [Nitrospiraceae bacterium]